MTGAAARKIAPADVPAAWRERIARMDTTRIPCPGMGMASWPDVHAAMLAFVDEWAVAAIDAGWRTIDLFGVHRTAGAMRVDSTGVLALGYPVHVAAVAAGSIRLTRGGVYRPMTNPTDSIPIWTFGRGKP